MGLFDENSSKAFASAASSLEMPNPDTNKGKGTLGALPLDILNNLPLSAKDLRQLASTSHFYRRELEPAFKAKDTFINHLRAVLRYEKPLYPLPGNDDAAAAAAQSAHLTPSQESDLKHVLALFSAYQDYFNHYLAMHRKYRGGNCDTWPTEDMEELGSLFVSIKEAEKALPEKLIQGTGLGVLKAASRYLNAFANMNNKNNMKWDELKDLAVNGLGGAQKAAGENIYDLYFCGDSMSGSSSRSTTDWAVDLDSRLGSDYFLYIFNGRAVGGHGVRAREADAGGFNISNKSADV
jgi:hypothetical protein